MPQLGDEEESDSQPEVLVFGPWLCLYCGEHIAERVRRGGWPGRDRETVLVIDRNENYSDYLNEGELCAYGQYCTSECQACADRDTLEYIANPLRGEIEDLADPDPMRSARRVEIRDELEERMTKMRAWSLDREEQQSREG